MSKENIACAEFLPNDISFAEGMERMNETYPLPDSGKPSILSKFKSADIYKGILASGILYLPKISEQNTKISDRDMLVGGIACLSLIGLATGVAVVKLINKPIPTNDETGTFNPDWKQQDDENKKRGKNDARFSSEPLKKPKNIWIPVIDNARRGITLDGQPIIEMKYVRYDSLEAKTARGQLYEFTNEQEGLDALCQIDP